jgi:hypothetical protein
VTLIVSQQKFILETAIANHQHQMTSGRLYIENLGYNAHLGSNVKKLASTVPAYVDSDPLPLPGTGSTHKHTRTHAGEVPTQRLLGLHTTPSVVRTVYC